MMTNSITRSNPLSDLVSLQRELDRMWTGFGMPMRMGAESEATVAMPTIDILSRGEDMVIRADIPGAKPEGVDISVTDNMLTLKADREESHESKEDDFVVRERSWGSYERTMRLPRGVDPSSIHAEFQNGVLEIVVPGGASVVQREAVHVPISSGEQQGQQRLQQGQQPGMQGQQPGMQGQQQERMQQGTLGQQQGQKRSE